MERDNKGRFTTGNQVAKGNKNPFKARTSKNSYKEFSDYLLNNLSEEEINDKLQKLNADSFAYTIIKMLEIACDKEIQEERLKLQREIAEIKRKDLPNEIKFILPDDNEED
jgi:hypothetical protein